MLQVLNAKERNQAFGQFLVFFLITTALVVGAIYFNFQVPVNEKNQLRQEVSEYREESSSEQKFVAQMEEAKKYLDSLNKAGTNDEQVHQQLTLKLTDMEKSRKNDDTTSYGKLNKVIMASFIELQVAKRQLKNMDAKEKELNDVRAKWGECQQRLDGYIQAYGQPGSR